MSKSELTHMQIKRIEKEIRDTPYHKGTEHHIGRLRARLSKLKESMDSKPTKGGGGGGYAVKKQGDATVVLVGPPSVGKSTLINALTNAKSKIAPYAFTTLTVIPGMMEYNNAKIQILDVPGIIEGAHIGKGRGREVLSVARGADLIVIMTDVKNLKAIESIKESLEGNGIRLNKPRPNVIVEKKLKGGVIVHSNIKQEIDIETVKTVASEFGYKNAEITLKERLSMDTLIDTFARNRVYTKAIYVVNKADEAKNLSIGEKFIKISARDDIGLDDFKQKMWEALGFIRVYLVRIDEDPSFDNPLVVREDMSLTDVAETIGLEFAQDKKNAKIWNTGAKFPGQTVSLSTRVADGMQIRFI